jgi:hypothetical protein
MQLVKEYETANSIVREYEGEGGFRWTTFTAKEPLPDPSGWWESPRILPGSTWANAAARAGQEDEYIDGMRCRFGGEW